MLKKLGPYARPYSKWIAVGVLCSAAEAIFELLIPLVMADIVNIGIETANQNYILQKGLLMMGMAVISLCFGLGAAASSSVAGQGFGAELRRAEYEHIQDFAFSNIEKFSTASLVTRLTNDVNNMQMTLMMGMRLLVRAPVMLVAALVLSIRLSRDLSNVFLVVIPLLLIVIALILTKAGPLFRSLQERTDALNLVVQENLTGIRVVKSFVREDYEEEKFAKRNGDLKESSMRAFGMVVINMPVMMLCVYTCILLISWFGAQAVVACGGDAALGLSTGELTSLFTYTMQILSSLMMLSMVFVMIVISRASMERIDEVLQEPSAIVSPENAVTKVADGSIVFDNVTFRYNAKAEKPVLDHVSLNIASGQTVGILGGTGSSKSSLVQLIPRLYDVSEGSVSVGGVDVRRYDLEALRDAVAFVLQKNELFSGTIKDNLRWGNEHATDEEMIHACKLAQADGFIQSFPDGYDTYIEQGGTNVSGGQKQRLCIARALLKNPKVLILDDSTSAVDTATDALIRHAFREEIPNVTKIIIAQRVASVMDADQIVVLDEGRLMDVGTHDELMSRSAIYREVYESQMKGGDEE